MEQRLVAVAQRGRGWLAVQRVVTRLPRRAFVPWMINSADGHHGPKR